MGSVFARITRLRSDRPRILTARPPFQLALLFSLLTPWLASAAEQAEEFVKGLQDRGLHDLAQEYLEGLKTSPLANDATKRQVPYLRGVALIEQSRQSTDPSARNRLLDEARKELEQFAEANPQNVEGAEAQLQLATVQMTRGQEFIAQAVQLPKEPAYDSQRKDLGRDARLRFAEARDTYQRAETTYSKELEKLPPATESDELEEKGSRRQELRSRVAQLRFLAAQTQFEAAQSYPPEADEFRKLNEAAAAELSAVYDEFSRLLVGLYARLYEGRSYQAIGNYQLAMGCYEEILGKINALPAFQKLVAATIRRKAEVLIAQGKFDEAIEACNACLSDANSDEQRQAEWVAVRFRLAEALSRNAQASAADTTENRKFTIEAREAYRLVAKSPGEFQLAARAASTASTAGNSRKSGDKAKGPAAESNEGPKTFQAAYDLGKEALSSYNAAKLAIPSAERNNPPAVPELKAQMEDGKDEARRCFTIATALVEDDTDPKLINEVRYFLCWLYWEAEDYYRAAILGEFLARRFPDLPAASSAAKISMASYERLANLAVSTSNHKDRGDFEAGRMAKMAELIARRWPGTEAADSAFGVLVTFAIRSGKTDDAEKMLQQASAQSRPRLELLLGNALWRKYLELSLANDGKAPDEEALAKAREAAIKYLHSGFEAAKNESPMSEAGATAGLFLAQAMLSDGNYADAIELLEDKKTGPLSLIEQKHAAAANPPFAIDVYKSALRAYVSVTPPQEKKAMSTMQALEQVVRASGGDDAKTNEQLTRIYIGMGVALQKQMDDLRAAGKQREANRVADAFAKFLDRISTEQQNASWPVRVWLAQTYSALGTHQPKSSAVQPGVLSKAARENLSKSRDAYQKLVDEATTNPKLPPSDTAVLAAKLQLGECLRSLGQYQEALDTFSSILNEKENSLEVQRAAALAYQERGQREDPKWFENAIHGGVMLKSTGQNRIWGWLKISKATARPARTDERFRDAFFESRLNVAKCRYLAAMKLEGDARQQDLVKARQSIQSVAQLYPDLGGQKWKAEFDELMKQIQTAESENAADSKDNPAEAAATISGE
jgi:tetratricopeptide (TPR) repeat protein